MSKPLRSAIDRLLFNHMTPIMRLGEEQILQEEDLPPIPQSLQSNYLEFKVRLLRSNNAKTLLRSLVTSFLNGFAKVGALVVFRICCGLLVPVFTHSLLERLADPSYSALQVLPYAIGLSLSALAAVIGTQYYFDVALKTQQAILSLLNLALYKKTLNLSSRARLTTQTGEIINHIAHDAEVLANLPMHGGELYYAVCTLIFATGMLFSYLGTAASITFLGLTLVLLLSRSFSRRFLKLNESEVSNRDKRVTLTSQILNGIRIAKYFAWERNLMNEVTTLRTAELAARRRLMLTEALSGLTYLGACSLLTFATYFVFSSCGGILTAPLVFATLSLFKMLEFPLGSMARHISNFSSVYVSAGRLSRFFQKDEDEVLATTRDTEASVGVTLQNVTVMSRNMPVLKNITLEIAPGEAVAIVGPVGAGKSIFLQTLAGELHPDTGSLTYTGIDSTQRPHFGFVPQESYIRNGSLRDNILFGNSATLLQTALKTCALEKDLSNLSHGLHTEIGEQGINLSGGQRARLCLARAVVQNPQVVLLDDPLSAVDVNTEEHLIRELIFGTWSTKTRIVATHRLAYLSRFDKVVLLDNGKIVAQGKLQELIRSCPEFLAFYREELGIHSVKMSEGAPTVQPLKAEARRIEESTNRITTDEDREEGVVNSHIYLDYIRLLSSKEKSYRWSPVISGLLVATLVISLSVPVFQNLWLAHWLSDLKTGVQQNTGLVVFGILGLASFASIFLHQVFWFSRALHAGSVLHESALTGVLNAPLRFFDSTPSGRILNRFSKDAEAIDRELAWSFESTVKTFANVVISLGVMLSAVPVVAIFVLPVLFLYKRLSDTYRASAREIKRINAISRSPRFSHVKETLMGLQTIRIHSKTDLMMSEFKVLLDRYIRTFYASVQVNRWFSIRIPILSSVLSFAFAIFVVFAVKKWGLNSATAAMSFTYALSFWETLNWGVRSFSEVESRMTSVERLNKYAALPPEPNIIIQSAAPTAEWPQHGDIVFSGLYARYAEGLPHVLKGINLHVPAGTSVGIVGRTGSGKSTLFQCLFRIIPASRGAITIDGKDIASVPLSKVRRSIAIIPQDPTLFAGTIRSNLDRFQKNSDEELWRVLRRVHLADFVTSLKKGLDSSVNEGGTNLSLGQRQLLCLARALLIDAKIVVLDEATASIDTETDALIQETLRTECRGKTLLIIAHRLETISNCDQIVELRDGRIVSLTNKLSAPQQNIFLSAGSSQQVMEIGKKPFHSLAPDIPAR